MAIRPHPAALLAPLLLGLASTNVAQANQDVGVYQWKDARGITHYGDAPPARGTFRTRALHAQDPVAPATPPSPAAPAKATPADNCAIARANLERLKTIGPIGLDADGDGKPDAVMDAAQRGSQAALAERNITTFCAPAAVHAAP